MLLNRPPDEIQIDGLIIAERQSGYKYRAAY